MKKVKMYSISLLFLGNVLAQIGCMDNSKHGNIRSGYDYKTLHYVACSCPCEKYRHLHRKGKCFKCRHYVKPDQETFNMNFLYEKKSQQPLFAGMRPDFYY